MRAVTVFSIPVILMLSLLFFSTPSLAQKRYGELVCQQTGYNCYHVLRGQSWTTLFPDENQRAIVERINRMSSALHSDMMIAVPVSFNNIDYMQLSPFDRQLNSDNLMLHQKTIIIDPKVLAYGAYDENGSLVRWGPVAMGKNWCPDINAGCRTKTGDFNVYRKGSAECESHTFPVGEGGAPMPYCMFFKGGYAIHAGEVPGYNASHGCVRVFYEDAQWLSQEFVEKGTRVIVRSYEQV